MMPSRSVMTTESAVCSMAIELPMFLSHTMEAQCQRERFGEARNQLFVFRGERRAIDLVAQVDAPAHLTFVHHRHDQRTFRRRAMRREADRARVGRHAVQARCLILLNRAAKQQVFLGCVANARGLLGFDAGMDKPFGCAIGVEDLDGAVAHAAKRHQRLDAAMQQLFFGLAGDHPVEQAQRRRAQTLGLAGDILFL